MDEKHIEIIKEKIEVLFQKAKEIYPDLTYEEQIDKTREVYKEMFQEALKDQNVDDPELEKVIHVLFDQHFLDRKEES